jgi:hypothetical protein
MRTARIAVCVMLLAPLPLAAAELAEQDPAYYHTGELAGSLRANAPLPLFDADPQHLWNRIFEGDYIDQGSRVEVIGSRNAALIVRASSV